ncbi:ATP-binding protein [Paenibacillus filicis]|uniref:histidine kinase n=1 Tax=Paenibacillus gyeongsangnamensis TaxID=3388067 RepID=A0ABT4Q869_9BACL|nr:ATP-binding protein [Paenibacillus filicis]MCZ8513016.1 ATP-binding protein [Paenibacillus filicis]
MINSVRERAEAVNNKMIYSSDEDERKRLQELDELQLVHSEPEEPFDRITRLVAQIFQAPICLISLITKDRGWFISCIGLPEDLDRERGTEREAAFCQYAVAEKKTIVAEDVLEDSRFAGNRLVLEYGIRFYAGAPLITSEGNALGTLCILDYATRRFPPEEQEKLADFARWVVTEIELRRDLRTKEALMRELTLEKERLAEQQELVGSSFESGQDGRLLCKAEGSIVLHNRKLLEMFLVNPLLYSDVWDFWHQVQQAGRSEAPGLTHKLEQLLSGEQHAFSERYAAHLSGEDWRFYEVTGSSVSLHTNGKPKYAYIAFRDRTEEEVADQLKNEFISVISHELRTPLTSIIGFVEILIDRSPDAEKSQKYLQTVYREANRLTHLLNDLLDLQKMESGKQDYLFAPTDLTALIYEILDFWDEEKSHRIVIRCEDKPLYVLADADRLKQALHNLVSNAVKYSPGADRVDVELLEQGGMAVIRIRDYGLGIPDEAKEKLFTKFYRVDNSDRRKIGGTGLGLAIVREIINAHGGTVEFDSTLGQGTTFTIRLELLPSDM